MNGKPFLIRIILLILMLVFFATPGTQAFAHAPMRGNVAVESTEIDRATYVDGGQFRNEPSSVKQVRIGLCYGEGAVDEARFTNRNGQGFAIGSYDAERVFQEQTRTDAHSIQVAFLANGKHVQLSVVSAIDQEIVYRASRQTDSLAILPLGDNRDGCWFLGEAYRGGFECVLDHGYLIRVINCLELEDYVRGVVPYEMSPDWPREALRAQAVCARTYVVYNQNLYEEYGFDLTDDTESQVYRGLLGADATTDQAVMDTEGQYVRYQGEICDIYYFASDGGASEDGKNVFGWDRPYLLGKVDPFERAVDYSFSEWEEWLTGENISWLLRGRGYELAEVLRVEPEYSALGNVIAVNLYDVLGQHLRITGKEAYTYLHLNNCRYTVQRAGDYFWFQGSGWGHNCGMSQWGARAMAQVYGYDYQDIIRFYFTGAYVA